MLQRKPLISVKKNDNDLFYTCSLIEYIGRKTNKRKDQVMFLKPDIQRIYGHADVFHRESIEKLTIII